MKNRIGTLEVTTFVSLELIFLNGLQKPQLFNWNETFFQHLQMEGKRRERGERVGERDREGEGKRERKE